MKKKTDLTLIVDFGGSGTKFLYWKAESAARSLFMEPEVTSTSSELIEQKKKGSPLSPEMFCWFTTGGLKTKTFAVGALARQFQGHAGLGQNKYTRAAIKAIAGCVVLVASDRHLRRKKTILLDISMFLPYGEASNFPYFQKIFNSLTRNESGIQTDYGTFQFRLNQVFSRQEGEGIYRALPNAEKSQKLALMMVGYRNMSVLTADRGTVLSGQTTDLGMIRLVEQVGEAEGLTDFSALAAAIAQAGLNLTNRLPFQKLFSKEPSGMKQERIDNLVKAIARSRQNYVDQLVNWFREVVSGDIDTILLAGGTATYLGSELSGALQGEFPWVKVNWHGGLTVPSELVPEDTFGRFNDVYGEYLCLTNQVPTPPEFDSGGKAAPHSAVKEQAVIN